MLSTPEFRRVAVQDVSAWTLRDVFDRLFILRRKLAKSTRTGYESTLTRWELITGNPTIADLSDPGFDFEAFADHVRDAIPKTRIDGLAGDLSPAAANKELRQLQAILSFCGPRGRGNRKAQNLLAEIPFLEPFNEPEPAPRFIALDELDAIYRACHAAKWPREEWSGIPPALWWQSSLVYLSNCGTRPVDWLALKTDDVDLNRAVVSLNREQKTGKANRLPLARCVVDHLRGIWGNRDFVWPAPKNKRDRNATFKAIQIAAGICEPYRIKDLRSTCGDRWFAVEPSAARGILNHSKQETTNRHYARAADHEFSRLAELAEQVEQPAAFLNDAPQLRVVR